MRIIVAQIGARHNYAVPRMLENSGHLVRLYTDSCANKGIGLYLGNLLPENARYWKNKPAYKPPIPGISKEKIYAADVLLWENIRQQIMPRDFISYNLSLSKLFARDMIKWGTISATMIYSMFGEGLDFIRSAKSLGLKIAIEIFITPIAHRIIREERIMHPEWEAQDPEAYDEFNDKYVADIIDWADLLVCPSQSVTNGLMTYPNFDIGKSCIVQYGLGIDYGNRRNSPHTGRVLFVGQACLRKGIHYLAEASNILAANGKEYEIRVVGTVADHIRRMTECKHLNFVGQIPRFEVIDEYMSADVFVLPTLAEGSATVVHEALMAGVPVITTESAGSNVAHNVEGMIIPERDAAALAEAICTIVEDRTKRDAMAKASREHMGFYSEEQWSIRLIDALRSVNS